MFKLRESAGTFDWPVKAKVPGENGKYQSIAFTGEFRILPAEQVREAFAPDAEDSLRLKLIEDALVNIRGLPIVDDDDNEITDRARRCEIALGNILMIGPITSAFIEGVTGHKSKN